MSAIVVDDCDCDAIPTMGFPGFAVEVFAHEQRACIAWLEGDTRFRRTFDVERPAPERYYAVHFRDRHVIGVRP